MDLRSALDAILFWMSSDYQRHQRLTFFQDESAVDRTFIRQTEQRVFDVIWVDLIEAGEVLDGGEGEWQEADGSMGNARSGGEDWAKNGMKRCIPMEGLGLPLTAVIALAHLPDAQVLDAASRAVALERPPVDHDHVPPIALIRDEGKDEASKRGARPRRWVV